MGRPRKDGTPAKKPERKPKEEKPKVELVYDPAIAEEHRREQEAKLTEMAREKLAQVEQPETEVWITEAEDYGEPEKPAEEKWTVTAIRSEELGEFYFDKKFGTIDWRSNVGEEISLTPLHWAQLAEEIPRVLRLLGAI